MGTIAGTEAGKTVEVAAAAVTAAAEAASDSNGGIASSQERMRITSTKNELKGNRQSTPGK